MRLFHLELKRILTSRRSLILIAAALLMSVVMACLPIGFESVDRPGANGEVIELDGMAALRFKQAYYRRESGELTPQRLAEALRRYQACVAEYGSLNDVPLAVYHENILAIRPMLKCLPEAFADPETGIGPDLMDIDPDAVEQHFYEKCAAHLDDVMALEQKEHPAAGRFAAQKYAALGYPFFIHYGMGRTAFDYIIFHILILALLCTAIAAPVFASEYQTGSDSILRCTKFGRGKLAAARIGAVCCTVAVVYLLGMAVQLTILDLAFGPDCLQSSFQTLFSVINLPELTLWQLQVTLVLVGLLSVLASVGFSLFLSAKCRDPLSVLLLSVVLLLLPTFAYSAAGATWLSALLPSAGIGLKNSFLYQLCDFCFLHLGSLSVWTPYVILASAAVELPLFLALTARAYCRHQAA